GAAQGAAEGARLQTSDTWATWDEDLDVEIVPAAGSDGGDTQPDRQPNYGELGWRSPSQAGTQTVADKESPHDIPAEQPNHASQADAPVGAQVAAPAAAAPPSACEAPPPAGEAPPGAIAGPPQEMLPPAEAANAPPSLMSLIKSLQGQVLEQAEQNKMLNLKLRAAEAAKALKINPHMHPPVPTEEQPEQRQQPDGGQQPEQGHVIDVEESLPSSGDGDEEMTQALKESEEAARIAKEKEDEDNQQLEEAMQRSREEAHRRGISVSPERAPNSPGKASTWQDQQAASGQPVPTEMPVPTAQPASAAQPVPTALPVPTTQPVPTVLAPAGGAAAQADLETPPKSKRRRMLTDVILSSEVNFQNILKKAEKPELLDVELHDHLMAIFQGKHVKERHSMKGITPQSMLPEAVAGAENAFGEVQGPDEDGIDPTSLEEKQKKEYAVWQAARAKDFRFAANGKEGNVLAGRFDRYKSSHPDCKKAYEALRIDGRPNIQAQEDFRREWAMKKFENYKL
ncbi:unnamed protein product, partial [Prorocentrum cordatum]